MTEIKLNKIYHTDCVEGMKQLQDNVIDLVICSPPYQNLRDYKGFSWDFKETAKQLYRVTKKGGVVVWVVGDETIDGDESGTSFEQALFFKKCGFKLYDTMIYKKYAPSVPSNRRYYQVFEYMFVLSKDGPPKTVNLLKDRKNKWIDWKSKTTRTRKKDGTIVERPFDKKIELYGVRFNIWEYKTGFNHSTKDRIAKQHPAIMPEQLATDHIKSWSKPNDLVLDPMCGSGTVCKMAKLLNRRFLGFDISRDYVDMANKRVKSAVPIHGWI